MSPQKNTRKDSDYHENWQMVEMLEMLVDVKRDSGVGNGPTYVPRQAGYMPIPSVTSEPATVEMDVDS